MAELVTKATTSIGRFFRNRKGSITVEFVATLPIIVAALAFSYEFGRCLWAQQIATKDVRDAARYLSRQQAPLTGTVKTQAQNLTVTGQVTGGTAHFPWSASTQVAIADPYATFSGPPNIRVAVSVIEVRGTIPLQISFLSFLGINTSITLVAADQVRLAGN
jgi:Flp pilus assembly protein TadG